MAFREKHFVLPFEWTSEAEAAEQDEWGGHKTLSANRTWLQWFGNCVTLFAYNRVNSEQALFATGFWFLVVFFCVYKIFMDAAFKVGKITQLSVNTFFLHLSFHILFLHLTFHLVPFGSIRT
jgi:hypothetical protein